MFKFLSSLTEPMFSFADEPGGTPPPAPVQPAPEAAAEPVKDPGEPPKQELDWTKDERYERMWKKDPNGLYKSYGELEKVYNPLKEKHTALEKQDADIRAIFKEFGVEPSNEQIKAVLDELKQFRDPNNPIIARANYLSYWADHKDPNFKSKFMQFMTNLEKEEMQKNFPGWTEEQINDHLEMKRELAAIKEERAEQERVKLESTANEQLTQGLAEIKKFSDSLGFAFTDEIKNQLIEYCMANRVPPAFVYQTFVKIHGEALMKSHADKIKQEQLQELNKHKAGEVPGAGGGKPAPKGTEKKSFKEAAMSALGFPT